MASRAMAFGPPPQTTTVHRALQILDTIRPREMTAIPEPQVFKLDVGLRAGIKINFTPDHRGKIPDEVLALISNIKRIEALAADWDSYGGYPLNDSAVAPAFELALSGHAQCAHPTVVPLPNGGLGLRWRSAKAELEIDVGPDGLCEAVFEELGAGEIDEINQPTTAASLVPLVHHFCRVR